MLYDCFRAASYKLFNILPRPNIHPSPTGVEGTFIVTYLYQKGDVVLLPKQMVNQLQSKWKGKLKGKAFPIQERSSREIVLIYANSDIIIRNWRNEADDYYSFFLLPHNGYLQIEEKGCERMSWAERHADKLRIVFEKTTTGLDLIENSLKTLLLTVQNKKYSIA